MGAGACPPGEAVEACQGLGREGACSPGAGLLRAQHWTCKRTHEAPVSHQPARLLAPIAQPRVKGVATLACQLLGVVCMHVPDHVPMTLGLASWGDPADDGRACRVDNISRKKSLGTPAVAAHA